jgi:hypothetical protein
MKSVKPPMNADERRMIAAMAALSRKICVHLRLSADKAFFQ